MNRFFHNPLSVVGALIVLVVVGLSLSAGLLPLPDPAATALSDRLLTPGTPGHWLGTDLLGRDILSRLLWGTRLSLAVAAAATLLSAFLGSTIGLLAGYFGKRTDALLMRSIDMLMAFPYLLLALAIVATLGPGLLNALVAIAIVNIPFFARTVRGVTVGLVRRDFVDTARMSGRSELGILLKEVLPNVFPVIVITMATTLGWMILETAGLSFLGLGAQPPQADLGSMLADGRKLLLLKPHLAFLPGIVVFVLVMGINLLGDGIRDVLDPRLSAGVAGRALAATVVSEPGDRQEEPVSPALIEVKDLTVAFRGAKGDVPTVRGVGFSLGRGGTLGLVGESGSGKSVTALSLLRLLPSPPATIVGGSVVFDGEDLLRASGSRLRALRGNRVGYVFQDPLTSLNPMFTAGDQIAEAVRLHRACTRREAWQEAVALLDALKIPNAKSRAGSYPHELSGGMRQRVGIAMALANRPDLLIADEPTTALDVTVQRVVMDLLRERITETGTALLFISHDLALVSELCSEVLVMKGGKIVERGTTKAVLNHPDHAYTRELLTCLPSLDRPAPEYEANDEKLPLIINKVDRTFPSRSRGWMKAAPAVHALEAVSFEVPARSVFGIVGESGSGKSTLARTICGLLPVTAGSIAYQGRPLTDWMREGRAYRRQVQIVFQDPASSLNPRLRIRTLLEQPLKRLAGMKTDEIDARLQELLEETGLPADALDRLPHEFSGGQAQRVGIARALAANPEVLVLDEAVSALDVSVQAKILNLLTELQRRKPITMVFISHDLAVVREFCTHVAVLQRGHLVEVGPNEEIFSNPTSEYTRTLLGSAPRLRRDG